MPLTIVRPGSQLPEDRRKELGVYLQQQWLRAKRGRTEQVDSKYSAWQKTYTGTPLESVRTVPFYKASNFVVKLVRMFADTFMSRSLNILFATKPLYVVDGLPQELKDSWELYLNRKALYEWDHYNLAKSLITQGNKNGTAVVKTSWVEKKSWDVSDSQISAYKEKEITEFAGPQSTVIPFDDFYLYPITATCLEQARIIFNRIRFIEEDVKDRQAAGDWEVPEGQDLTHWLKMPQDVQRSEEQASAGIVDPYLKELELIECHTKWAITNDSTKLYNIVALLHPESGNILDIYYNPYPQNLCIFNDYRPYPRDDIFYGESMCEILGQSQEEASRIHNERRDNSTIASSVCFKRRSSASIPNPSTNWYPGKVWDLEDLDDLETFDVGRNYNDMIQQEDYTFQLAEKLSGIGEVMQGAAQGNMAKRGVYNTMGTLSIMAEGNQRQDTNIKDVRLVLSQIGKVSSRLQATYGMDDPFIDTLPESAQEGVRAALKIFNSDKYKYVQLEVKPSSAGMNSEIRKANMILMGQTISVYGQTAIQMATQLANPGLNPVMKQTMIEFIEMQRWMAKRLLKELDEWDAQEILPDVLAALQQQQQQQSQPGQAGNPGGAPSPGGGSQEAGSQGVDFGGALSTLPALSRSGLEALSQVSTQS